MPSAGSEVSEVIGMDNVMKLMKTDKAQCSGCYACCNICPVDAIRMKVNEEGFWYPSVDETVCIHCADASRYVRLIIVNRRKLIWIRKPMHV